MSWRQYVQLYAELYAYALCLALKHLLAGTCPSIADAAFYDGNPQVAASIDPEVVSKLAAEVRASHRSPKYCDNLMAFAAGA